ncbi:MAG: IS630 family transposase [Anaerolineae bacterium]
MIKAGKAAARTLTHARILLKADEGDAGPAWTDEAISTALDVGTATIERVRRRFVEEGLEAALQRRAPRRAYARLVDGECEAHLIALACSTPPEGRERWTLRLLADRMVELGYVPAISHETVRQGVKKNELKPWLKQEWCIPPEANAEFIYHMEDVLDLYTRPADPMHPLVCLDETSKQLIGETRTPLPAQPGQPERFDYEYVRHGVANLFMFFAPFQNWRHVKVTEHRTKADWAACMRELVDVHFPNATRIIVIADHLNTHNPAVLYEIFAPAEAKRLLDRLEFHYTPKHGSWLNMAEIELSVLSRQCLAQRIPDQQTLSDQVAAWEQARNKAQATINWRFTTSDARIKLKRLYPSINS